MTHLIIDEGTDRPVGLAKSFVAEDCNNDLATFKTKCNPDWGWDDAKKEAVFALATAPEEAPSAPLHTKKLK